VIREVLISYPRTGDIAVGNDPSELIDTPDVRSGLTQTGLASGTSWPPGDADAQVPRHPSEMAWITPSLASYRDHWQAEGSTAHRDSNPRLSCHRSMGAAKRCPSLDAETSRDKRDLDRLTRCHNTHLIRDEIRTFFARETMGKWRPGLVMTKRGSTVCVATRTAP